MAEAPAPVTVSPPSEHAKCPPWCTSGHTGHLREFQNHYTPEVIVRPDPDGPARYVSTWAVASSDCLWKRIFVGGFTPDGEQDSRLPMLLVDLDEAKPLADIIDLISSLSPEEHHRLAEGVRRSAALIKDAPGGRA